MSCFANSNKLPPPGLLNSAFLLASASQSHWYHSFSMLSLTREWVPSLCATSYHLVLSQLTNLPAHAGKMEDFCGTS